MFDYKTDLRFHYEFLETLARRLRPSLYVGFGLKTAECIRRVSPYCERAIGVDIDPVEDATGFEFFLGSTADFARCQLPFLPPVDMAFIDADHSFDSSLKDFESLLPHVSNDGVVLLHDTYPEDADWTTDNLCGDCYRTADMIYRNSRTYGVEIVTLPIPPGISIIRKRAAQLNWL